MARGTIFRLNKEGNFLELSRQLLGEDKVVSPRA